MCIRFNKTKLLANFRDHAEIKSGFLQYKLIKDLRSNPPDVDSLPFIKRKQYEDEGEFRIIYQNDSKALSTKDFNIDLHCIEHIVLSPWLPKSTSKTTKQIIRNIEGCASIRLSRTGVVENSEWKNIVDKLNRHD